MTHDVFMEAAIAEAELSSKEGGIPIGAVLVRNGEIVGRGHNQRVQKNSPTLHAEMDAIENVGRQPGAFYKQCVMYTTLSPCIMCSGAILFYKIPQVIIAENLTAVGDEERLKSSGVKLEVLQNQKCVSLMQKYIREQPDLNKEDSAE